MRISTKCECPIQGEIAKCFSKAYSLIAMCIQGFAGFYSLLNVTCVKSLSVNSCPLLMPTLAVNAPSMFDKPSQAVTAVNGGFSFCLPFSHKYQCILWNTPAGRGSPWPLNQLRACNHITGTHFPPEHFKVDASHSSLLHGNHVSQVVNISMDLPGGTNAFCVRSWSMVTSHFLGL